MRFNKVLALIKPRQRAIIALCLLFICGCLGYAYLVPVRPRPFNQEEWKVVYGSVFYHYPYATPGGNTQRAEMLPNLLGGHLKIGMKQAEVRSLLGPPNVIDGTGERGDQETDVFWLVQKPRLFALWQLTLLMRYRNVEPYLYLRYRDRDHRLVGVTVK